VGFLQKVLFTLQFYNYLQLASMDSPFAAAVGPTHLLTSRILNSPESTVSTAVPSHSSHALRPYSFFAQSSDFYAVDPLSTRNGLACSLTLQITSTLIHTVPPVHNCSPLMAHSPELFTSLSYSTLTDSTTHSYLNSRCMGAQMILGSACFC